MKCQICNSDTYSSGNNVTLCITYIYSTDKGFDAVKEKCVQFNAVIKNYPLFITTFCTFDLDEHDTDRVALQYLRGYVISEDNNTLQKHHPVKTDESSGNSLYKTIAILCRLDVEDGARELRVRNIIDMLLNAEVYHAADPDLHSCLKWGETWRYFVLEQLREKEPMKSPNAVLTFCLHSLATIINMRIRSVYPNVPGGNDDLRKRLDRIFSPLDIQANALTSTVTILWSNAKPISSHSTSSMWIPDCIIPLLPKPDCYVNDILSSPRASSAALQSPAERSFYLLSCFCPITQSSLNELVPYSTQEKHSEAEMKKEDTRIPEFRCPKCSKTCNDYRFDWRAVTLFRQNFNGARLTYILVDITSSMTFNLLKAMTVDKKTTTPRITQTKEAIKQLLIEVSIAAGPLDQAVLTTFDNKLNKSAVIPLCNAADIADMTNLSRIDDITLSPRSVETHFYTVLKDVYEMLERQPFLYIDLYIFSDGIDTSPKKNDKAYQALIRGLNQTLGAKCHFMNCGSASDGFSVAAWLGDPDADCLLTGDAHEIKTQVRAIYKRDHARQIDLTSTKTTFRGRTLNVSPPTLTTFMTDAEAATIRKPRPKQPSKDELCVIESSVRRSNPDLKTIDDYLLVLPSAARSRSATATENRSKSPEIFTILTRNLSAKRLHKD